MSTNEIIAPNGPSNKMSLPVIGTVVSGDPVKVGSIVGVAQTSKESVDGGTTGVVNSNAPGNVTVWNGGVWRLPVTITGTAKIGDPVFAKVTGSNSTVALQSASASGLFVFGVLREASAAGTDLPLAVADNETTGAAVA